jgi:hypothetical protein
VCSSLQWEALGHISAAASRATTRSNSSGSGHGTPASSGSPVGSGDLAAAGHAEAPVLEECASGEGEILGDGLGSCEGLSLPQGLDDDGNPLKVQGDCALRWQFEYPEGSRAAGGALSDEIPAIGSGKPEDTGRSFSGTLRWAAETAANALPSLNATSRRPSAGSAQLEIPGLGFAMPKSADCRHIAPDGVQKGGLSNPPNSQPVLRDTGLAQPMRGTSGAAAASLADAGASQPFDADTQLPSMSDSSGASVTQGSPARAAFPPGAEAARQTPCGLPGEPEGGDVHVGQRREAGVDGKGHGRAAGTASHREAGGSLSPVHDPGTSATPREPAGRMLDYARTLILDSVTGGDAAGASPLSNSQVGNLSHWGRFVRRSGTEGKATTDGSTAPRTGILAYGRSLVGTFWPEGVGQASFGSWLGPLVDADIDPDEPKGQTVDTQQDELPTMRETTTAGENSMSVAAAWGGEGASAMPGTAQAGGNLFSMPGTVPAGESRRSMHMADQAGVGASRCSEIGPAVDQEAGLTGTYQSNPRAFVLGGKHAEDRAAFHEGLPEDDIVGTGGFRVPAGPTEVVWALVELGLLAALLVSRGIASVAPQVRPAL